MCPGCGTNAKAARNVEGMQTHEALRRPAHVFGVRVACAGIGCCNELLGSCELVAVAFRVWWGQAFHLCRGAGPGGGRGRGCRRGSICHGHCGGDATHSCDLEEVPEGQPAGLAHERLVPPLFLRRVGQGGGCCVLLARGALLPFIVPPTPSL